MSIVVNMHEAKSTLSGLVEQAEAGEEVIIARAGVPAVRLVPATPRALKLGAWKGKIKMCDDFDAPLSDELLDAWEGSSS